jgi:hypothetical protein
MEFSNIVKSLRPISLISLALLAAVGPNIYPAAEAGYGQLDTFASRRQVKEGTNDEDHGLQGTRLNDLRQPVLQDDRIFFWSRSALTLFGHTAPTASEWYQIADPDLDYRREVIERWKPPLEIARHQQALSRFLARFKCFLVLRAVHGSFEMIILASTAMQPSA